MKGLHSSLDFSTNQSALRGLPAIEMFAAANLLPPLWFNRKVLSLHSLLRVFFVSGAALNVLLDSRQYLGSLGIVARVLRLGMSVANAGDGRDQPKVADATAELNLEVFGKNMSPSCLVFGTASLPLGVPIELQAIFEVAR